MRPATCPIIAELSAVEASVVHPVAIVSPGSATGRTTLAVNVAAALVRAGIKVLLVSSSAGIIDIQALDALGWNLGQTDSSGNPAAVPTAQRLRASDRRRHLRHRPVRRVDARLHRSIHGRLDRHLGNDQPHSHGGFRNNPRTAAGGWRRCAWCRGERRGASAGRRLLSLRRSARFEPHYEYRRQPRVLR